MSHNKILTCKGGRIAVMNLNGGIIHYYGTCRNGIIDHNKSYPTSNFYLIFGMAYFYTQKVQMFSDVSIK